MCVGQNCKNGKGKVMRSRLKKIFHLSQLFFFFLFLDRSFFLFLVFFGISNPHFPPVFFSFSSFDLSKTVLGFLMGLNLAILERVLNRNFSKPVQRRSTNRSWPFLKSVLAFLQPVFLNNQEKGEPKPVSVFKAYTLASVQQSIRIKYYKCIKL